MLALILDTPSNTSLSTVLTEHYHCVLANLKAKLESFWSSPVNNSIFVALDITLKTTL